jgi:hypothetical protein
MECTLWVRHENEGQLTVITAKEDRCTVAAIPALPPEEPVWLCATGDGLAPRIDPENGYSFRPRADHRFDPVADLVLGLKERGLSGRGRSLPNAP